ncbi:MAG: ArnT family glycosyltransferase [Methylophilaceae bacterium]|nr:glycosyltransferase family 39 protein [Methyloradius sp.]
MPRYSTDFLSRKSVLFLVVVGLCLLAIIRSIYGFYQPIPLQVDEAQYLGWAHDFTAGYYSKPPFIAWALGGGAAICSGLGIQQIEGCTRMLQSPALLLSAIAIALTAFKLFGSRKIAVASALLFLTMPLSGFYALVASTDAWLFLWWSFALLAFVVAQKEGSASLVPWILCGVALGFGLLTKYSMGIFVFSAVIWLLMQKRLFTKAPFIAGLTAFIVFLPNILWNIKTGFPTLTHHLELSHVDTAVSAGWDLYERFNELFGFFSAQFLMFGPLAFLALLIISSGFGGQGFTAVERNSQRLLLVFTWPMLGIILLQAFMSRAHGNWAAPAYVAASILVAAYWLGVQDNRLGAKPKIALRSSAFSTTVIVGLIVSVLIMIAPHWSASHEEIRTSQKNPLRKLKGWKEAALWAQQRVKQQPMRVMADDRDMLAALSSYGYPETYPPLAWNPSQHKDSHYRWFYDVKDAAGVNTGEMLVLLVGPATGIDIDQLERSFEQVTPIHDANLAVIPLGGNNYRAWAFIVRGFKGYQ